MKRKLTTALALLLAAGAWAQTECTAKFATLKHGGGTRAYPLQDRPRLTMPTEDGYARFYVKCLQGGKEERKSRLDSVQRYTFGSCLLLSEDEANLSLSKKNYNGVRLTRTLRPGIWNTFCVPFNMSQAQVKEVFGDSTKLRKYKEHKDNKLIFESTTSIAAGVAYLVMPGKLNENPTIVAEDNGTTSKGAYTAGMKIEKTAATTASQTDGYGFHGVLCKTKMATNGTQLFINAAGKLKVPGAGGDSMQIKGMRAYVVVPSAKTESEAKLYSLVLDGDDEGGETTGIAEQAAPTAARNEDRRAYTLDGRLAGATAENLPKGVYIVGGRKVVIK